MKDLNHSSVHVTCVQPNGYNLSVASYKYMHGYIQNFAVCNSMVYKIPCCLQAIRK